MTPIDMGVAQGWSEISSGRLASFASADLPRGFMHPKDLLGHVVSIDNANYLVTGVKQRWGILWRRLGGSRRWWFGLLVEPWIEGK